MLVFVDRLLVERVDPPGLSYSARGADLLGDRLEAVERSPGEMELRALTSKGEGDRAADRAAGAVNDRVLAFEQHVRLHPVALRT